MCRLRRATLREIYESGRDVRTGLVSFEALSTRLQTCGDAFLRLRVRELFRELEQTEAEYEDIAWPQLRRALTRVEAESYYVYGGGGARAYADDLIRGLEERSHDRASRASSARTDAISRPDAIYEDFEAFEESLRRTSWISTR